MPVTPLTGKSASETFSNTRQTAISKRSNALQSVEGADIKSITDAWHFDEFVNEIAVRSRLLHLEAEQDDVLPERESLPRIACREPGNRTAGQHHGTFDEPEESGLRDGIHLPSQYSPVMFLIKGFNKADPMCFRLGQSY